MGRLNARMFLGLRMLFVLAIGMLSQAPALATETTVAEEVTPTVTKSESPAESPVSASDSQAVAVEKVVEKIVDEQAVELTPLAVKPRPLFQHATYSDAWRAAQKSNRPILVYVSMPNCLYCVKMKNQVYQQPRIKKLVSGSFETMRAGRYTHASLVKKLRIKWYPTTVLVGPNNKILDVIEGYAVANKFQQRLNTGIASLRSSPGTTQIR